MTGDHYEDFELLAYLDLNVEMIDVASISQHLDTCSDCTTRFDSLRQFNSFLGDKSIHQFAARRRLLSRMPMHDLIELANRRSASDRGAERTFVVLMGRPIESWPGYLGEHPAKRTEGLSRRLIAEARVELDRRPRQALKLLDVAAEVANGLVDIFAVAEQRGAIEKERANALRMLGRYAEALESLDSAERFFAHLHAPDYDLNFVHWARATVLFYMTRYAESLTLARTVFKLFRQFGETYFANQVQILEANALCEQGDADLARTRYVLLAAYFAEEGDEELVARLTANIAECEVRLDHPESAALYAADAMRRYEVLGMPVERIRVRWSLGYRFFRQGYYSESISTLESASAAFEALGMTDAAGGVGLDLAEVHLVLEQWEEAEHLARRLVKLFGETQTPVPYARAYGYLREAVAARTATASLIEYLRTYLSEAADDQNLPFIRPDEPS